MPACASPGARACTEPSMDVTAVTVTYGDRWNLLRQSLGGAFKAGAARAIVLDNGCPTPIAPLAEAEFPGQVHTVRLDRNLGSAGGFHAALQAAFAQGAE